MKVKCILLTLAFFVCTAIEAQTTKDIVYLKNGSIISGTIIEQVPNVSLKVQISDGSVFAYSIDDVEKITKENTEGLQKHSKKELKKGKLYGGYHGFVDFGYAIGVGHYGQGRLELSTSHGVQIMPYLFTGVGLGIEYYHERKKGTIPIFAHIRASLPCRKVCQPFFDWKIGYGIPDGFYMVPSIGCRFTMNNNAGVGLSIGYSLQKAKSSGCDCRDSMILGKWHTYGGTTIKVSFDF